jgi:hypothetical protein
MKIGRGSHVMRTQIVMLMSVLVLAAAPGCMWNVENMSPEICQATAGQDELWLWVELEQRYSKATMPRIGLTSIIPQFPVMGMYPEIYWTLGSRGSRLQEVVVLAPTGLKTRIPIARPNGITFSGSTIYRFKDRFWLRRQEWSEEKETLFAWADDHFERLSPEKNDELLKEHRAEGGPIRPWDMLTERDGWKRIDVVMYANNSKCYPVEWHGLRLRIAWDLSKERAVLRIEAEEPQGGFEPVVMTYLNGPGEVTDEELRAAQETTEDQRAYAKEGKKVQGS